MDWNGKPVARVKIIATQVQPIKGYEQFEAVTGPDGAFRLKGMYPSSAYVLKPWSDKWSCKTEVEVYSGPQGETAVLPAAMIIEQAYAKNGRLVIDLGTGTTRFAISGEGVISDTTTGLEWVVGPDEDTDYARAEQWVAACAVAGGGWRMPTRAELKGLYQKGVGERNMDPGFKTTGWWVWAEPKDLSSLDFGFDFGGRESSYGQGVLVIGGRVFGVRSRPRK